MTQRQRVVLFGVAAGLLAALFVIAITGLPSFGTQHHPYGARAVHAAVKVKQTTNTVTSVNFDQRAIDTMGEEFILFTAAISTLVLLRRTSGEDEDRSSVDADKQPASSALASTALLVYVMLVVTTFVGLYIVAHGALSPGGGFQGGVILATGVHLLYVGAGYVAIRRARPMTAYEVAESLAAAAFVVMGLAATALTGAFLANVLPLGALKDLLSGGTTEIFNAIVGMEVASAFTVVIARFLEQHVAMEAKGAPS